MSNTENDNIKKGKVKSESEHQRYASSLMGSVRAINMFAGDASLVTLIATSIFLPHKKSHLTNKKLLSGLTFRIPGFSFQIPNCHFQALHINVSHIKLKTTHMHTCIVMQVWFEAWKIPETFTKSFGFKISLILSSVVCVCVRYLGS